MGHAGEGGQRIIEWMPHGPHSRAQMDPADSTVADYNRFVGLHITGLVSAVIVPSMILRLISPTYHQSCVEHDPLHFYHASWIRSCIDCKQGLCIKAPNRSADFRFWDFSLYFLMAQWPWQVMQCPNSRRMAAQCSLCPQQVFTCSP